MITTERFKVLLITSEFPPNAGGIGNHAYNLAYALASEGYAVTVVADIVGVTETERNAFAKEQPFTIRWVSRSAFVAATYLKRIYLSLKLARFCNAVICSGKFSLWIGSILKSVQLKNLVAVVHGSELDLKSSITKKATSYSLARFQTIISVSRYTQKHLPAGLPPNLEKRIIPNGINLAEFQSEKVPTLLFGEPALITVGSVTERKGQENVLRALPVIRKDFPGVCYHLIGKPIVQEKLENIGKSLGVDSIIHFYGAINRKDLLQKLAGAAIKLMLSNHTSNGDFEGFGIAVLEANAFGVPVIGSRNSGLADAIVDGKTGILVDQTNPAEVTDAIRRILENYSFFSANAKEWARQHDWKIIVKEYKAILT